MTNPALFADIAPPPMGSVVSLDHTLTAARYKVPKQWNGGTGGTDNHSIAMVTFTTTGSDLYVAFGDAGVMVSAAKRSQVTGETISPHWGSGTLIPDGGFASFPVTKNCTHFAVDSTTASGCWTAYKSSGEPHFGDLYPTSLPLPDLHLDFTNYNSMTLSSGIAQVVDQSSNRALFAEATNKPALNDAATVGSGLMRAAASFTSGSSQKLTSTNATTAGIFDGTGNFTLVMPVRRGTTGAVTTLFSTSTSGSANGNSNLAINASDDLVYTRLDSAGVSTATTYATTISTTPVLVTLVYSGSTPTMYINRTVVSSSGVATGDLGTNTHTVIGAKLVNESTYSLYATCEIPEVIGFASALGTADLIKLHDWAGRRYGL